MGRRSWTTLAASLAVLAFAAPAPAADGDLDPSFGGGDGLADGRADSDQVRVALQPDGKILLGGETPGGDVGAHITRLTASGEVDTSFGRDGLVGVQTRGGNGLDDIAVQPDGRILVTARARPELDSDVVVFRLNPDGTPDTTFGGDGEILFDFAGVFSAPADMLLQPDGRIVIAGSGSAQNFHAARLNPDGSLDPSFSGDGRVSEDLGGDAIEDVRAVALQGSRIILAGYSNFERTTDLATSRLVALALTANGERDSSFGPSGNGVFAPDLGSRALASDVIATQDGGVLLAGERGPEGGTDWALVKLDLSGRPDAGFSGDGLQFLGLAGVARSVTTTLDGRFAVSGGAPGAHRVAKVTQAGALEPSFGDGGHRIYGDFEDVSDLVRQADGKLLLGVRRNGFALAVARILDSTPAPGDPELPPDPPATPSQPLPVLELTGGSAIEGQLATFTATLSEPSSQPVTFNFITGEGTAATGLDFGGRRGTVTIPPGATSANLAIATDADRFFENDESFRVELSDAVNANLGEYVAFATIVNDLRPGRCQNIVEGRRGTDVLTGSSAGDLIIGRQDIDFLFGLGGDDCIRGERGGDIIDGGDGDDLVDGGSGNDRIRGGDGNDRLYGRRGRNRYDGGNGDDRIYARNGVSEIVECGAGRDVVKVDRSDRLRRCERVTR